MRIPWIKQKLLLSEEENRIIVKAIRHAEKSTSGEVRVYVESHCSFMDPMDRAAEIFFTLKMDKTELRNAVLIYVAIKDHQFAIFGDEGNHQKVGTEFWNTVAAEMVDNFSKDSYAEGIASSVIAIGDALQHHFPFQKDTDKNELPDNIVFGR